ncbi:MAG: Holliday junction resolvase RuvX [Candidatus Solibacter usitatus]|nr:Holliday junction resolvase RuvX [Candidatus Solibacter usitatus]
MAFIGGRILGLDVGMRRIGLALSDPLGITAQGIPTLVRRHLRKDLAHLTRIAGENGVVLFVAGYPLQLSGDVGRQAILVQEFTDLLQRHSGIPVKMWDERFTTVVANRVLRESGMSQEKRGKAVDRLSAVLILQSYLDSVAEEVEWPEDASSSDAQ